MTICLDRVGVLSPTKPQLQSHIPKLISKNLPIYPRICRVFKKNNKSPNNNAMSKTSTRSLERPYNFLEIVITL